MPFDPTSAVLAKPSFDPSTAGSGFDPSTARLDEISPYSPEGIAASRQAVVQSEAARRQMREEQEAEAARTKLNIGVRNPLTGEIAYQAEIPGPLVAMGSEAIKSSPSVAAGAFAASQAMPFANRVGAIPGPIGTAGRFGIPLVAGGLAAIGTRLAQEEVLPQILPESVQQVYDTTGQIAAENPKSAMVGQFLGSAPFFRPGLPIGTTGATRLTVPLVAGGIGAGIEGAQQIARGEFDPQALALSAAGQAFFNRETALGAKIAPNMVLPNITARGAPAELGAMARIINEPRLPQPTDIAPAEFGAVQAARGEAEGERLAAGMAGVKTDDIRIRRLAERMMGKTPEQQIAVLDQEVKLAGDTLTKTEQRGALDLKQELQRQIDQQNALEEAANAQQKAVDDAQKAREKQVKAVQDIQKAQAQDAANAQKAIAEANKPPEIPKSEQILSEPVSKPPVLANVATEIGTQTSPFALQGKLNELTGTPAAQQQIDIAPAELGLTPAVKSPEVAKAPELMTPEEHLANYEKSGNEARYKRDAAFALKQAEDVGKTPLNDADGFTAEHRANMVKQYRAEAAAIEKKIKDQAEFSQKYDIGNAVNERAPVSSAAVDAYGIALPAGYVREGDRYVLKPNQGAPTNAIPEQIPDASLLRSEQPKVELPPVGEGNAAPQVPPGNEVREGAVQEPLPPSREQRLNDAGSGLPPISSLTPDQARAELSAGGVTATPKGVPIADANSAQLKDAVGKMRRGELNKPADIIETLQSRKRLPKRPRGEVASAGPDMLYDAAHDAALDVAILGIRAGRAINEVIQMAVAKLRAVNPRATEEQIAALTKDIQEAHGTERTTPLVEAEQLMANAPSVEPVAGRAPAVTQEAARMRQTRGAASPQAMTSIGGAGTGAILGYAETDQQPGETDEAYQARRLKNAVLGAAAGAGAGYVAGSGLAALARADARRSGNRYAPKTEPGTALPTPGEGQGIRQTAEKIIENKSFPKRMRDALANDPAIFYDQFGLNAMRDRVKSTPEQGLVALMASQDPFERLAATAELANRYALSPDPAKQEQAAVLARQFAQNMTNPAQIINLGKLIESPDAYVDAVRETLKGVNRDLSKAQQTELVNLKRESLRADKALDEAATSAKADFSAANERAYVTARDAAAKAALAVDKYTQRLSPESWGEILSKTMKGNLLTFRSLVQNPFGNTVFQPVNRGARAIASDLDAGYSILSGKPRTLSESNPFPSTLEAKAFWQGVKVGAKELLTGPGADSYAKSEIQKGFEPIRSLVQAWTGEGLAVRPDGTVAMSDRLKRAFEATPMAINAEAMFRFLNLGDKPFRRSEEMRVLLSQAKLKGLKGRELERFLEFPDEATQRLIETEGRHAIFAQDNKGVRAVNSVLDHALADALNIPKDSPVRDVMKVAATTVAPYRQFPVNYVINSMNYALPALGYGRAIKAAAQGDRRAAFIHAGEATMGLMMYGAAAWLWKNGLISEPFSKDAKSRTVQYENMGPGRINISGLDRARNGGDPRWRSGDTTITWETMGVPSFAFSIYTDKASKGRAEAARTGEPSRKAGAGMSTLYNPLGAFPGFASAALDQSFLAGVSSLLDAVRDPDRFMDAWSQNTFRAVSSIAVPNNLEAFARTQYRYIPELRGDTMTDSWKNIWAFKTRELPMDDRAILKRGIWGQPIERTPGDKNPYLDQFVDITKSQRRELDPLGKALYSLFEQTESPEVYPSIPDRNLSVEGVTVKLMPDAYDKYQQMVGAARKQYAQMVVDHPGFADPATPPEAKLMALGQAYSEGAKAGRNEFVRTLGSVYFPDLFDKPATEFSRSRIISRDVKARGKLRAQGEGP